MINTEIVKENTFNQLSEKCNENRHCLEMLRFFGAHPNTRFNRLAILQAQNESDREFEVEKALVHLINQGILKVCIENNARLYSLTEDESRRKWVFEMVKLEWHHWQLELKKATCRRNEAVSVSVTSN